MIDDLRSYSVTDFVLFSSDSLKSLVETYNQEIWPVQILAFVLAVALIPLTRRDTALASRIVSGILAAAWLWTGLVFQMRYFTPINWAAKYFGWLFVAEAALLLGFGIVGARLRFGPDGGLRQRLGLALFLLAAFVPLSLIWGQSPIFLLGFGWGPDQTALGTIGILLMARVGRAARLVLLAPALVWCAIAAFTYYGIR